MIPTKLSPDDLTARNSKQKPGFLKKPGFSRGHSIVNKARQPGRASCISTSADWGMAAISPGVGISPSPSRKIAPRLL